MNKLLMVLLAVCLVSVHAFVKRDAEAAKSANTMDDFKKQIDELVNKVKDDIKVNMDPDHIKKQFNDVVDKFNKFIKSVEPKSETPK